MIGGMAAYRTEERNAPRTRRRYGRATGVLIAALGLSACATPVVGALTVSHLTSIAGFASSLVSGRDLTEHALSIVTGKDCRLLEAVVRDGRHLCEEHGSPRTEDDFQGVFAWLEEQTGDVSAARKERGLPMKPGVTMARAAEPKPQVLVAMRPDGQLIVPDGLKAGARPEAPAPAGLRLAMLD